MSETGWQKTVSEAGDCNTETAKQPLERWITVRYNGGELRIGLRIPAYIVESLRSHDWDRLHFECSERARAMTERIILPRPVIEHRMAEFAAERVYALFMEAQVKAGNPNWVVPRELQPGTYDRLEAMHA